MSEERRLAVLRAIVQDYVDTSEPVGSKALLDRHHLGVSAATIRNDMAVLEEEGLIAAPHTSAGRIPTNTPCPACPTATPTNTPTPTATPTNTPTPLPYTTQRVNAGGTAYTDGSSQVWPADQAYLTNGWGYTGGTAKSSTPAASLEGKKITTIEGLDTPAGQAVQKAWAEMDVVQCGGGVFSHRYGRQVVQ